MPRVNAIGGPNLTQIKSARDFLNRAALGANCDPGLFAHEKALRKGLDACALATSEQGGSAAFLGALARVFLAAGGHATLQAHALAAAGCAQGRAGKWFWPGGAFAICFSNYLVAHLNFLILSPSLY
jgi:hypothetical protein